MTIKKLDDNFALCVPGRWDLAIKYRFACGILAIAGFWLLATAAGLRPEAAGLGTHEQLGFPACGFYERTGWPCPTCGMTTSFSYFARGNWAMAFYTQPAGAILAILALLISLAAFDAAVSGAWWHEKVATLPLRSIIVWGMVVFMAGWMWSGWITYWRT